MRGRTWSVGRPVGELNPRPADSAVVQVAGSRCWQREVSVKVLVVEDDKKIATAVKRGLEAEGFAVEVAVDGRRGPVDGDRGQL